MNISASPVVKSSYILNENIFSFRMQSPQLPSTLLLPALFISKSFSSSSLSTHFACVFDKTSISSWNAAIGDLSRSGHHLEALLAFSSLRRLSLTPDRSTFPPAIKSAASLPSFSSGRQLHLLAFLLGLTPDLFVASSLVRFYSSCSLLPLSLQVFDETPHPNAVLYTALSTAHIAASSPRPALNVFSRLLADLGPADVDDGAVVSALSACARIRASGMVGGVHGLAMKLGLEGELGVANTMIDAYAKSGEARESRKVFDGMPERDVVSWNTLVAVYAQSGLASEALEAYLQMVRGGGLKHNAVTLSTVLLACAHAGALQVGKCVHDQVIRMGLEENVYVGTSVVDMYCKCGRVEKARKAFSRIKDKNVKSWSAMVAGYGMHGHGREALELFNEMIRSGVKPNHITLVSVLDACSHSGLVDEGRHWFRAMKKDFGIDPGVEHYGCMVDLLGRAGCLSEAYSLIKEMKTKPDCMVWGALLSACRTHKNVELGEISARKLFELEPTNCGYYVSLSNIYAEAARWKDVERMRVLIKNKAIVKPPGYSFVELNGKRHMFLIGDRRHPQHEEIYNYLEKLRVRMQVAGFVPDTGSVLHDVDIEEKETILRVHSEKLAVAFAIMNTSPGSSILIIKNLRVCGDCHSAFKIIAKLEGREIVVRDSRRFHHFKYGLCSCGDYW